MDIDKFQTQHASIHQCLKQLRAASRAGIAQNAKQIAGMISQMSSVIKLHLAAEDSVLYPSLRDCGDEQLAHLGEAFERDMEQIIPVYTAFARRWVTPAQVQADPEGFRADANVVLKALFMRMRREEREFYPKLSRLALAA